jgi:hypothetical protein
MSRHLSTILVLFVSGCSGMADEATLAPTTDAGNGGVSDTRLDVDTNRDVDPPDSGPSEDALEEVEAPFFGLKDDADFLVPGSIVARSEPAASGSLVAWVERPDNASPTLSVWDLDTPTTPPRTFEVPNLINPRHLALSDAFLVYTDDRYGDPDVFAIDLASGLERTVASGPGAQERPAILGSRVAWEDCSACVTGDGPRGREPLRDLAERDLATALPATVFGTPDVADHSPRYGLLDDGRPALAWVSDRATLRVERLEAGLSLTLEQSDNLAEDEAISGLSLVDGALTWRPSPLIVNPDSMIVNPDSMWPSDVLSTDLLTSTTTRLTTHAELGATLELSPDGRDGILYWLESPPAEPRNGRLMRATLAAPDAISTVFTSEGLNAFTVGRGFVAFIAPRQDNDGEPDLHVLRTP